MIPFNKRHAFNHQNLSILLKGKQKEKLFDSFKKCNMKSYAVTHIQKNQSLNIMKIAQNQAMNMNPKIMNQHTFNPHSMKIHNENKILQDLNKIQNSFLRSNYSTSENTEQHQNQTTLSHNLYQFIQNHKDQLPIDSFKDIDAMIQMVLFQAHLIFRHSHNVQKWSQVYYELVGILHTNARIFSQISNPSQLTDDVTKDIENFKNTLFKICDLYANSEDQAQSAKKFEVSPQTEEEYNLPASDIEREMVGKFASLLIQDIIVSSLPTVTLNGQTEAEVDNLLNMIENQFLTKYSINNTQDTQSSLPKSLATVVMMRKAMALLRKQNYNESLDACEKAISIEENFAPSYIHRANIELYQEKFDDAVKDCDTGLKLEPNNADAHMVKALSYIKQEKYEDALNELNNVLQLAPGHVSAISRRSGVHFALGNVSQAILDIEQACTLQQQYYPGGGAMLQQSLQQVFGEMLYSFDSTKDAAIERLIIALFNKVTGNTSESLSYLNEAIEKLAERDASSQDNDDIEPVLYHQRGTLLFNLESNTRDAIDSMEKSLEKRQLLRSKYYLGLVLRDHGMALLNSFVSRYRSEPPERIPSFDTEPELEYSYNSLLESLQFLPVESHLKSLSSIGSIYVITDENDKAVDCFTQSIKSITDSYGTQDPNETPIYERNQHLRSELAAAYFNRGHVLHTKKTSLDEALEDYNEAIRLNSSNPLFYQYRSTLYKAQGEDEKARQDEEHYQNLTQRQQQRMQQYEELRKKYEQGDSSSNPPNQE